MDNYNTYVGMDVHARSIMCTVISAKTGETYNKHFKSITGDEEVAGWISTLQKPVLAGYESGCTGYHLAERLNAIDEVECKIIAISTLPKSPKDTASKCDKIDSKLIASELANRSPRWKQVYIPSKGMQAKKELARTLHIHKQLLKEAKQRLNSFLIRQGFIWNQKTKSNNLAKKWTRNYYKWLDDISFKHEEMQFSFSCLIEEIQHLEEKVKQIKSKINELSSNTKDKQIIDALTCLQGVNTYTAYLIYATFVEFSRFHNGRKIPAYFGFIPKENSSGERSNKGHTTKSGDKYVRYTVVEGLNSIARWRHAKSVPKNSEVSEKIISMSKIANIRIKDKFNRLNKNKHTNVAKVACAAELLKWSWALGCQVEREIAK